MDKLIIAGLVVLGALFYHYSAVSNAETKGKESVQKLWDEDKVARQAIVDLKLQEKAKQEEELKQSFLVKEQEWRQANEEINARNAALSSDLERMRNQLKKASTRNNGLPLDPGNTCTSHAVRITQIAELLREGTELHVESIRYLEQLGIKVEQLQSIIKEVKQTQQ